MANILSLTCSWLKRRRNGCDQYHTSHPSKLIGFEEEKNDFQSLSHTNV